MSADLFAEFNNPPSGQAQQQQRGPQSRGFPSTSPGAPQDDFNLLQSANSQIPPAQQSPQQWSTFQTQSTGGSNWGSSIGNPGVGGGIHSPAAVPAAQDEDDGWGDFEVAGNASNRSALPATTSWQTSAQSNDWEKPSDPDPWASFESKPAAPSQPDPWQMLTQAGSVQSESELGPKPKSVAAFKNPEPPGLVRASTMDIIQNNLVGTDSKPPSPVKPTPPSYDEAMSRPRLKQPSNPNVMFDADDFELEGGDEDDYTEDDDFGDFEAAAPTKPNPMPASKPPASAPAPRAPNISQPPPSMDLLSLDDPTPPPPQPQELKSKPGSRPSKPLGFGATALTQSRQGLGHLKAPSVSSPASKPVVAEDEEWGAWDEFESKPARKEPRPRSPAGVDNWDWEPAEAVVTAKSDINRDEPPPMNVPPPSVLLSAFPSLFSTGNSLFKPMSAQKPSIKERILSDPKAVDFLKGYILIATAAGHVIAGRKQRWHRDKILAKSMSISAAGSKGMKLAGVDKTQSKREDREAADVAIAWGEYVGRLRSAVAAANSACKTSLKVPELNENMLVQTDKTAPTAPKPCIVCGLKREERVAKVDFDVEDSFGEWWVDYWGHRTCKNFWLQHEQTLRQR